MTKVRFLQDVVAECAAGGTFICREGDAWELEEYVRDNYGTFVVVNIAHIGACRIDNPTEDEIVFLEKVEV